MRNAMTLIMRAAGLQLNRQDLPLGNQCHNLFPNAIAHFAHERQNAFIPALYRGRWPLANVRARERSFPPPRRAINRRICCSGMSSRFFDFRLEIEATSQMTRIAHAWILLGWVLFNYKLDPLRTRSCASCFCAIGNRTMTVVPLFISLVIFNSPPWA